VKTTLDIPDELFRQAQALAASEKRDMQDLVQDGLRLLLGREGSSSSCESLRMTEAPIKITPGNVIPILSNDEMALVLEESGERQP
jgi:hypothetical protein